MSVSIPVDVSNPGQVFACLGFLEAAESLVGDAEGGFDEARTRFQLKAGNEANPFEIVLDFLVRADVLEYELGAGELAFPGADPDPLALPLRLSKDGRVLEIGHWADGSSRNPFKLYAGNRSAYKIAGDMLEGIKGLWKERHTSTLLQDPFGTLAPVGGSFNFDPRGAWTALDAGFSLNDQGFNIRSSPVVEFLAAVGLENARPDEYEKRRVRYGVWQGFLPPALARPSLFGGSVGVPLKTFNFRLDLAGKNKVVTFAQED